METADLRAGSTCFTAAKGCPVTGTFTSPRTAAQSPAASLAQDVGPLAAIIHMNRERIPERVVHAKGAGAFGEFEVTHDISNVTCAAFLGSVGKKTKLVARFSNDIGERGTPDSVRDARGFAFKLYTEEGNLDWLLFNMPVFPIRDAAKFPTLIHAQKKHPQTNLRDPSAFWDFMNHNTETYHFLMRLFSDACTPASYRHSEAWGISTFKFTQKDESFSYFKIYLRPNKGVKNFTEEEAESRAASDPDYLSRDLFQSISKMDFPSWDVFAQILSPQQATNYPVNIFDPTKIWPQEVTPYIPFGRITLNRNSTNFFAEVEQAAFSPANIVPGWENSPEPILQSRLFAYEDASRYRLGINFQQLQINQAHCPYGQNIQKTLEKTQWEHENLVQKLITFEDSAEDEDFKQPRLLWQNGVGQASLIRNVVTSLKGAVPAVRTATYDLFQKIDMELANGIKNEIDRMILGT